MRLWIAMVLFGLALIGVCAAKIFIAPASDTPELPQTNFVDGTHSPTNAEMDAMAYQSVLFPRR